MATCLSSGDPRSRWMRLPTAQILKRFFFCERTLLVSAAAWIPLLSSLEFKTRLPRMVWQCALTADQLRNRVLELRFPNRMVEEEGPDASLMEVFRNLQDAPSPAAFLLGASQVLVPALREAYHSYLDVSDFIADGPTHRFLSLALSEKVEQEHALSEWAESVLAESPSSREDALAWTRSLAERLSLLGGVGTIGTDHSLPDGLVPGSRPYRIPDHPARDTRFQLCRFYWPDIVDPKFPYGEGIRLQLRSAISHLNEVWAIETGGVILSAFAGTLPWEWIRDAARWTYDESRHCRMGFDRLMSWGFRPEEIPLGNYIYESAAGQDPIYRLGMLFFFETKNIRHKPARTKLFRSYGDALSEHDMDFDWADEAIHAGYGKRWLREILQNRGEDPESYEDVREHCRRLVSEYVATVTPDEAAEVQETARNLIERAERLARIPAGEKR